MQQRQGTLQHLGQCVDINAQPRHASSDQERPFKKRTEHLLRSQLQTCLRGVLGAPFQDEGSFFCKGGPDGGHRCGLLPGSPGRVRALGASHLSFPRLACGSCVASAPEEGPSRGDGLQVVQAALGHRARGPDPRGGGATPRRAGWSTRPAGRPPGLARLQRFKQVQGGAFRQARLLPLRGWDVSLRGSGPGGRPGRGAAGRLQRSPCGNPGRSPVPAGAGPGAGG